MKRVLICPLDWGLGHATRCIPVINEIEKTCEVVVAGSGDSLELLRQEFPGRRFYEISPYGIRYSTRVSFMLNMALQTPRVLSAIIKEHRQVNEIIKRENIEAIVSDNRYGCYHASIPSAIIIHQLSLIAPGIATYYNQKLIKRFNECWVPDMPDHRLSGKLSINKNISAKFIGPLSRLAQNAGKEAVIPASVPGSRSPRIVALVSGPEPHRSSFESLLAHELQGSGFSYRIVRGLPNEKNEKPGLFINHLPAKELNELMSSADIVICRSGYSTIMDLAALNKKAIFVPTPGQTEQLYLARELERKKVAPMFMQDEFSLSAAMEHQKEFSGFKDEYFDNALLKNTLREFLG